MARTIAPERASARRSTGTTQRIDFAALAYPAIVFGAVLILIHCTCLGLPYFWDEMGQFVPAALDILQRGAWVPQTTTPNIHPPGVMAYLALVWKVFGYSIPGTRLAMLLMADAGLVFTFFLAVELCKGLPGRPAFLPVVFLLASPLFYTQSMMAQLDMPAMVFTVLALWLFLRDRTVFCTAACTALVLMKETGAWLPALLAACLIFERRWRDAAWFAIPFVALAGWLAVLAHATGTIFGNHDFERYNVSFPLNPVRLSLALLRRFSYTFLDNFHFIGTAAILYAVRTTRIFRNRAWAICAVFALGQIVMVSVLGGAVLERYLLPVLPLFFIAAAAAWTSVPKRWSSGPQIAMALGMTACLWLNPPWPFPFEDNLSAFDFVTLQKQAAELIEANYSGQVTASAWPFPDALRRPEFGYVSTPQKVVGIEDFHRSSVLALGNRADVLVVYSRTWEPSWGIFKLPIITSILERYYFYEPQISREEIESRLRMLRVARFDRRGQWIEVYVREGKSAPTQSVALIGRTLGFQPLAGPLPQWYCLLNDWRPAERTQEASRGGGSGWWTRPPRAAAPGG